VGHREGRAQKGTTRGARVGEVTSGRAPAVAEAMAGAPDRAGAGSQGVPFFLWCGPYAHNASPFKGEAGPLAAGRVRVRGGAYHPHLGPLPQRGRGVVSLPSQNSEVTPGSQWSLRCAGARREGARIRPAHHPPATVTSILGTLQRVLCTVQPVATRSSACSRSLGKLGGMRTTALSSGTQCPSRSWT